MHKLLRPESKLVQNGGVLAGFTWLGSNLLSSADNSYMGLTLASASVTQLAVGQTRWGAIAGNSLAALGYGIMGANALYTHNSAEMTTAVAGGLSTGITIFQLSRPERNKSKDNQQDLPTEPQKTPVSGTWNSFKEDAKEIAKRPCFAGSVTGALSDLGYLYSGLASGDATKIATGFGWLIGFGFNAISIPKNKQKNIFQIWYENIRDKVKHGDQNKNNDPGLPGAKPQLA